MRVCVATDHGGFGLKQELVAQLRAAARISDYRPRRRMNAGGLQSSGAQARVEAAEAWQTVTEAY